ncbi:hypothetical protein KY290_031109 [Solanum tuberosum]|uniref:Uncharacterized protein n=1 Tax=Solanum tuberosum TaxID=4113 RepID=A0ABQ7U9U0_SOLTU|nr:hypothetical protein KY290_031109 [Solanum tuberosum]
MDPDRCWMYNRNNPGRACRKREEERRKREEERGGDCGSKGGNILSPCPASSDEFDQEGDENDKSDKESEGDENGKSDKGE